MLSAAQSTIASTDGRVQTRMAPPETPQQRQLRVPAAEQQLAIASAHSRRGPWTRMGSPRRPQAPVRLPPPPSSARAAIGGRRVSIGLPVPGDNDTQPTKPGSARVREFAAVADLLHTALDGSITPDSFARVLASHGADQPWLVSFGTAVRELGKLIELGQFGMAERQKAMMAEMQRQAETQRTALSASETEREALREELAAKRREVDSLREQLAFHAQFSPPEEPQADRSPRGGRETPADLKQLKLLWYDNEQLKADRDRAHALTSHLQEKLAEARAQLAVEVEQHVALAEKKGREHVERLQAMLKDERARYEKTFAAAEERQDTRLDEAARRHHRLEHELKQAKLEAKHARAAISATQQVLAEARDEGDELREQLRRATHEMHKYEALAAQMAKAAAADLAQRAAEAAQAQVQAQRQAQTEARLVEKEQQMRAQQQPPLLPPGEAHMGLVSAGQVFGGDDESPSRGWTAASGDDDSRVEATVYSAAPSTAGDVDFYGGSK